MTNATITTTQKERAVLRAILTNFYTSANGRVPASFDAFDSCVWANAINDANEPSGIEGRALSGVVASLVAKKLARSDGECVSLTKAGYEACTRA
jgi:hypothetical protein